MQLLRYLAAALAAASLCFVGQSHAADCSFEIDSVDKFTKVQTRQTWWDSLGRLNQEMFGDTQGYVAGLAVDDERFLGFKLTFEWSKKKEPTPYELDTAIVVPAGSPLLVLLEDESVVELLAGSNAEVRSEYGYESGKYRVETTAIVRYVLTDEAAGALVAQKATDVRLVYRGGQYDMEIGKKSKGDIRQAVRCVAGDGPE